MSKHHFLVFFGLIVSLFLIAQPATPEEEEVPRIADLAIVVNDTPDPVVAGQILTYEVIATNHGPDEAIQVFVTLALPAQLEYQAAPNFCAELAGTVTCELGHLGVGSEAFGIVVLASEPVGELQTAASLESSFPQAEDPNTANNSAMVLTNVRVIYVSIEDLQVSEPKIGTGDAVFTVALSEMAPFEISVDYATADGTALAAEDYEQTSATVLIPPNTLEAQIAIPVKSDAVLNEGLETFYVNLSNPVNAWIEDGQAEGQIADACLFCDHFDDDVMAANWYYQKPSWIELGHALQGTPARRRAVAIANPAFAGCTNCSIQAHMRTAGGIGNKLWLLAWYRNRANTIELIMKEERDVWVLKQRVGGVVTAKKKGLRLIEPDVRYALRIEFDGTVFRVYVDDEFLMNMTATAAPSGTIGFKVKDTIGRFCSISVY